MKDALPNKNLLLIYILTLLCSTAFSQSPFVSTGRSGSLTVSGTQTINSYYHVTAISGHSVTCAGYSPATGDRVLLIQMTGPNAGNWEWDTVVTGGNPFMVYAFSSPTIDPTSGIVQAVTVPQYSSLTIPSSTTLTATPWNGTTGGILTFMVQHKFTIASGGKCDVSGLGWSGSIGSAGGAGGSGGTAGGIGLPGGDSLQVIGSGLGSGGNGGLYGGDAAPGGSPALTICPDCGAAADSGGTNLSTVNPAFGAFSATNLMLGGAGQGGAGGHGGIGAGGGGGGTATAGTAGGPGGAGGNSGSGGTGAGIILFSADSLVMPASGISFVADGLNGTSATNGAAGNSGGNGGDGLTPCNAGGGGGGGGGGFGGGGGGGGGGGDVVALLQHACANLSLATVQTTGGLGGARGTGGAGGAGGINGSPVNSTCSGSTAPATVAPVGPPGAPGIQGGNGNDGPAGGGGTGTQGGGLGVFVSDCSTNPITAYYPFSFYGDNCGSGFDQNQLQITGGDGNYNVNFSSIAIGCGNSGVGGYGYVVEYDVTITDGSGCSGMSVFDITYLDDIFDFSVQSQTNTSCPSASDGTVTLDVVDNFAQECFPAVGYSISGQSTGYYTQGTTINGGIVVLTGLPADNYSYNINGLDQCSISTSGSFTINSNNTPVSSTENVTICYGTSYTWNSGLYNQSGSYTTTLAGASAGGCDSIDNLHLTVESQITTTNPLDQFVGDGCGLSYDNNLVSPSGGAAPYTVVSFASGIASCYNFSFYGTYQPYTIAVTDANQCTATLSGSLLYYNDQFDLTYQSSSDASCAGASDGSYTGIIIDLDNEECIHHWTLTVTNPSTFFSYSTSGAAVGGTVTIPGLAPGTYTYSIAGGYNCSPTTTGTFTIGAGQAFVSGPTVQDTLCYGGSIMWHGTMYTQAGTYTDTLRGASTGGCDSLAALHLILLPQISVNIFDTVSAGGSVQVGSHVYSQSGSYIDTVSGVRGCDSIVHTNLYVRTSSVILIYTSLYDTICHGGSVTVGTHTYTQNGLSTDTLVNGSTDSIVTLHLTVYPAASINLYDTLITGDTLHVGGYVHYQSGIYYDTLLTVHGCDSAVTVYLYVATAATFANLFDTICQGFTIVLGGHHYTASGTYIDTLPGHLGGDSIVTLQLTVSSAILSDVYDTICQGSAYIVGGHSYTQTGIYVDTLTSHRGCDSVRALNLTVAQYLNPTATITVSHGPVTGGMQTDTFTASTTDCAVPYYTWFDNITPLGVHTAVITVTRPQSQADSITCRVYCHDQCASAPYVTTNSIIYTGIGDISSAVSSVNNYPNPTMGNFNMDIALSTATDQQGEITITDLVGQSVLSRSLTLHSGSNKQMLALDGAASGVYIIQLNVERQSMYFRIVLDK